MRWPAAARGRGLRAGAAGLVLLLFTSPGAAPARPVRAPEGSPRDAGGLVVCATCTVTSLRDAIRLASPGDRIRILQGVYREGNVVVDKPLDLVGEGFPVLDGEGRYEVLTVRADRVRIRGLVVRNSGTASTRDIAGIRVEGSNGCLVEGNRLLDTFFAIYLAEAESCAIRGNDVRGHATSEAFSGNAIHLWNSSRVVIEGNRLSGHRDGVYLEFVRDSTIAGNTSERNLRYGLHFMFSEGNEYRGNVFRENGAGVAVMYSRRVTMLGNRFERNWGPVAHGLLLKDIDDSRVVGNAFVRNTIGIYADGSNRVGVEGNEFTANGSAVRVLASSMGMLFTHNNFVRNTFDLTTNSTMSFNAFLENYWSAYEGYDLDRDGIGDVPYRPVRLFSLIVEAYPEAMLLLRSPLAEVLDAAERVVPLLTPKVLADGRPLMRPVEWSRSGGSRSHSAR